MTKKIIAIMVFIIIAFVLYNIEYELGIFNKEDQIQSYVKNISNNDETTQNDTYKKGDNIEYNVVINPKKNKKLNLNLENIEKEIKINKIKIDGKEIDKNNLENLDFDEKTLVTIEAKAIKDSNKNNKDKIITIKEEKNITKQEQTKEIVSNAKVSNLNIQKTNYSSNIDNLIKISGNNLSELEFINIGETSYKIDYKEPYAFALVPKNNILSGEQFVLFQQKNGTIITYNKKLKFSYTDSSILIIDITPKKITNESNKNIILQGKGFNKIISLGLSNNIILTDTSFKVINDNVMSVKIPKNFPIGTYTLNIMDVNGIYKSDIKITISSH